MTRQIRHELRKKINQQRRDDHQTKHRSRLPRDPSDLLVGHSLQHEQIKAHGRRDLRHLDHQHDKDAEPDEIDADAFDRRKDHAHGQHHHRYSVEEAAEDEVKDHQRDDQREPRQAESADPLREMARKTDVAHRERQKRRAGKDERDHAIEPRRAEQAVVEGLAVERALRRGDRQRAHDTERGGLGCGRDAGVDRSEHQGDQQNDRDEVARCIKFLSDGRLFRDDGNAGLVEQCPSDDIPGEERRQNDTRHDTGDEQMRNRHVGRHAVDDHDDRRRNQQSECTRAGERADGDVLGIAAPLELGQRHLADRGAGCRRRARHGGENRAADDVGV